MSDNDQIKHISLYHYQSCPFCGFTREAIETLGLDIETRDILLQPAFREELVAGGGKPQVPCLKIETDNGATRWLYESSDIIHYLKNNTVSLKACA
ncbi:MAG: glutaredoxin [Halieaceae bacterium]|nr:glutaredoxin [Halieaceae bacterium]